MEETVFEIVAQMERDGVLCTCLCLECIEGRHCGDVYAVAYEDGTPEVIGLCFEGVPDEKEECYSEEGDEEDEGVRDDCC